MSQNIKRIFERQGFIRLKGVLDYKEDLEPILNDMAFIMDRLIHRFVSKSDKVKVLSYEFKKKYSYLTLPDCNWSVLDHTDLPELHKAI